MAVPTSADFNMTFDRLFDRAMARIGGEGITGYNARSAVEAFQLMLADWSNRGVSMWNITSINIPILEDTPVYTFPLDTLDVLEVSVMDNDDNTELQIERIGRTAWQNIPQKLESRGRPTQIWIDRQRDAITCHIYPVPDRDYTLTGFRVIRSRDTIELFDGVDIPPKFQLAAVSGLTYYMAMERAEVGEEKMASLEARYERDFARARDADQDRSTFWVRPDLSHYGPRRRR